MSDQASSTDTSGSTDLKAGHAPAIKVGGMRVGASRPRHTSQGEEKEKSAAGDAEGGQENSGDNENESGASNEAEGEDGENAAAVATRVAGEMVSGTFVSIQKAFPTEAVRNIHDKPGTHPKHDIHTNPKHDDQRFLNQPRKQ